MNKVALRNISIAGSLFTLLLAMPGTGNAQVPVDDAGQSIALASEEIPLLSAAELAELVGPIALYPDDLLAIVLPATTYPLQLVQAERFLEDLKLDSSLKPDEDWDDSVVALINYPEVVELLTDELDQTWRLGEAVVAQQADVIAAIETFRDRAYAAGNLQSDTRQTVSKNDGVIEITPVAEDVIYVPYYEPERVVVYQSRPAYYYYPRPYPVYYYPYPYGYAFNSGFFWGVTTAFTVGWYTDSLHVYHPSYYGHPYYGHSYYYRHYWYRHPDIHVHNNYYYGGHSSHHGHRWQPHGGSTVSHHDQRVTRSRQYPGTATRSSNSGPTATRQSLSRQSTSRQSVSRQSVSRQSVSRQSATRQTAPRPSASRQSETSRSEIRFRERDAIKTAHARPTPSSRTLSSVQTNKVPSRAPDIRFRERSGQTQARSSESQASRPSPERSTSSPPSRQDRSNLSQASRPSQGRAYASQPSRPSQERSYASQPSRSSQDRSHSSQPSRSNHQPTYSSRPQRSSTERSGSGKVASASRSKGDNSSARDRH
jgi:hypothetical protein